MQQIERVGVIALLLMVVTIITVAFWEDGTTVEAAPGAAMDSERQESLAQRPAQNDGELQQIHGIGATKAERYGEGLLEGVRNWVERSGG